MKKIIKDLNNKLEDAYNEIDRLKLQNSNDNFDDKDYKIDKLNKIVLILEFLQAGRIQKNKKVSVNTYNYRTITNKKTGG